jgi:hypothetical protein
MSHRLHEQKNNPASSWSKKYCPFGRYFLVWSPDARPSSQFTILDSRLTLHDCHPELVEGHPLIYPPKSWRRWTIHVSRFTIHNSRFTIHDVTLKGTTHHSLFTHHSPRHFGAHSPLTIHHSRFSILDSRSTSHSAPILQILLRPPV